MLYKKNETNFWINKYETTWQIKMTWSWVRTIILMYNKNARDELSSETVMIMHITLYKCQGSKEMSTIQGNITRARRPTVARWGGPDTIFSLCFSSVFCLDYHILPYAPIILSTFCSQAPAFYFIFFGVGVPPPLPLHGDHQISPDFMGILAFPKASARRWAAAGRRTPGVAAAKCLRP